MVFSSFCSVMCCALLHKMSECTKARSKLDTKKQELPDSFNIRDKSQPLSSLLQPPLHFDPPPNTKKTHLNTFAMASIEQTWSLAGKVAVVTGSGRGIGKAMAIELAKRGAKVAVNYANAVEGAEQVVKEIKALGNGSDAAAFKANVGNVEESEKLMDDVVAHFGKLDICCSNSGVVSFGHFKDVTPEEFDRVFTINTRGQFFVAKAAYKRMEMGGRIILMGSITGQAKGVPKHAVYSGSKGAIETFTRCMAIDAGEKRITVNCVAPGGIKTDMYHAVCREYIPGGEKLSDDQVDEYACTWSPHNRVGQPVDIARVVCFLASQDGDWVNGKVIGIDGAACM